MVASSTNSEDVMEGRRWTYRTRLVLCEPEKGWMKAQELEPNVLVEKLFPLRRYAEDGEGKWLEKLLLMAGV